MDQVDGLTAFLESRPVVSHTHRMDEMPEVLPALEELQRSCEGRCEELQQTLNACATAAQLESVEGSWLLICYFTDDDLCQAVGGAG